MKIREILVCRLMLSPHTTGIGRTAKKKSVMILIAGMGISAWTRLRITGVVLTSIEESDATERTRGIALGGFADAEIPGSMHRDTLKDDDSGTCESKSNQEDYVQC